MLFEFAAGVGEVCEDGLADPLCGLGMAKGQGLLVVLAGLFVVLLLVVDDPEFGVDERV